MIWQTSRYCIWDYFNQLCIKVKKWNFFVLIFTLNCYVVLIYHLNMWCNPGLVFSSELAWGLPLALAHPLTNNGDQLQLLGATQGVTFSILQMHVKIQKLKFSLLYWKMYLEDQEQICYHSYHYDMIISYNDLLNKRYKMLSYSSYLFPNFIFMHLYSIMIIVLFDLYRCPWPSLVTQWQLVGLL